MYHVRSVQWCLTASCCVFTRAEDVRRWRRKTVCPQSRGCVLCPRRRYLPLNRTLTAVPNSRLPAEGQYNLSLCCHLTCCFLLEITIMNAFKYYKIAICGSRVKESPVDNVAHTADIKRSRETFVKFILTFNTI